MKELKLDKLIIYLYVDNNDVRVIFDKIEKTITNQNIENVIELIEYNFKVVRSYYNKIVMNEQNFDLSDINYLSISIVIFYLHMYNLWKNMYKKQEIKSLKFQEKDFINPSTSDIVFSFYKKKYPDDWQQRCSVLLGMQLNDLKEYYKRRELFYTK